jgi:hypothetical protein
MGAALTLVQAWVAAGRPKGEATLGKFETWAQVIGGILQVAEVPGFLVREDDGYESADPETSPFSEFVAIWAEKFGDQEITAGQLLPFAEKLNLGSGSPQSQCIRLGKLLAEQRGQSFAGWTIEKTRILSGSQRWRLTRRHSAIQAPAGTDDEMDLDVKAPATEKIQ